jgi:hypothetical protein
MMSPVHPINTPSNPTSLKADAHTGMDFVSVGTPHFRSPTTRF